MLDWKLTITLTLTLTPTPTLTLHQVYFKAMLDRNQAIDDVHNATSEMMRDPKVHMGLMKRLFGVFDVDHGGEIDGKEMRALMMNMHPHVPRGAISLAMLEVAR